MPADLPSVLRLLRGKWVKAPVNDPQYRGFAELAAKTSFTSGLFDAAGPKLTKRPPLTIDGVACIGIDDGEGVLWVETATGRPVRIDPPAGVKGGLTFSRYSSVPGPKAPPANLVVDVKTMGG